MDFISILILGLVQGIAEWLPISSKTMDTLVFLKLMGGSAEAVVPLVLWLHVGTLLAATLYFRNQIFELAKKVWEARTKPTSLLSSETGFLLSSLLMTALIGVPLLLLQRWLLPQLDAGLLMVAMGVGLLLTAGLLYTQQNKKSERSSSSSTWQDGLVVGALQGLSVLPGVSRSGTSTTGLVWQGFSSASAFELSFLLSIPTVLGGEVLLWLVDIFKAGGGLSLSALPISEGVMLACAAAIFGYLSIGALLRVAKRINLWTLAAAFGILMLAAGFLQFG